MQKFRPRVPIVYYILAGASFFTALISIIILVSDHLAYLDYLDKRKGLEFWGKPLDDSGTQERIAPAAIDNNAKVDKTDLKPANSLPADKDTTELKGINVKPAKVEFAADNEDQISDVFGPVYATEKGKKFHHAECTRIKKIPIERLRVFDTVRDAKLKGLSVSKDCLKKFPKK